MKRASLTLSCSQIIIALVIFPASFSCPTMAQRFQAASALTVGSSAQAVFVADFNKDGKPDLLVIDNPTTGSLTPTTLQVLPGNGDGTFQSPVNTAGVSNFSVAAVGDFNGDGIPDVAMVSLGNGSSNIGTVNIFLGNGNGTFTATAQTLTTGNIPVLINVADVNHDGILDLVVANKGDNTISVFTGKGDGTFALASTRNFSNSTSDVPLALVAGDFDGDGNPDLVVSIASTVGGSLAILKGNGDGTFAPPSLLPLNLSGVFAPGLVAATDFDADGKLDLIFIGFGSLLLFPGNGDLTFQSPIVLGNEFAQGIEIADMNGDGLPDIVVAEPSFTTKLLFNDGKGGIQSTQSYEGFVNGVFAIADLNGDGHPDIVLASKDAVASSGPNNIQIMLNDGDGTMHAAFGLGEIIQGTAGVSDFNHDGKPDIVGVDRLFMDVALNLGNFQFQNTGMSFLAEVGSSADLVIGDLNSDGNQDVVVVGSTLRGFFSGNIAIDLGNGDGTFRDASVQPLPAPDPVHRIAAGDFNGDGKLDVVVTNMDSNSTTVGVFLGNGDGTFQTPSLVTAGSLLTGIAVGDFNGDGHLDIAVANQGDGTNPSTVSILLGKGDGSFTLSNPVDVGVAPVAVAAADLNGDGKLDLVVANGGNGGPGSVSILMGNGDGTFQPAVSLPLTASLVALTLADFNGDGFLDIAVAEHGSMIDLFTNKGDGTFPQVPEHYAIGGDPDFLIAADLNDGGVPDLLTSGNMNLLPNRGGTHISLTSSQNPSGSGQQVMFSAAVVPQVPGAPAPTGTVQFADGASVLGSMPLSTAGTAAFKTSSLTPGTHTINANYSGDGNYPSRSFPHLFQMVTVRASTSVQIKSSSNPSTFGSVLSISASVTSAATGIPTGNISLLDGGVMIASATLDATGTANFSVGILVAGTHTLTASYAGDQNFAASVSPNLPQIVTKLSTMMTLSITPNPAILNSAVSFVIQVSPTTAIGPTGSVSLLDGPSVIASAPVDTQGTASFSISTLTLGTHTLTATYTGDANRTSSVSSPIKLTVFPVDFSISANAAAVTVNAGQSANATLTIFSNPSFTTPLTFSCSGLPAFAACSFNPATITPNATFESTTLTIATTGSSAMSLPPTHPGPLQFYAVAITLLGLAALLLMGSRGRRSYSRLVLCASLLLSLGLLSNCGGGSMAVPQSQTHLQTPDGTSTVVITASAGNSSVMHEVILTLNVKN